MPQERADKQTEEQEGTKAKSTLQEAAAVCGSTYCSRTGTLHTLSSSSSSLMVVSWDSPYRSYTKTWRVLHATLLRKGSVICVESNLGAHPTFAVLSSLSLLLSSSVPHPRRGCTRRYEKAKYAHYPSTRQGFLPQGQEGRQMKVNVLPSISRII